MEEASRAAHAAIDALAHAALNVSALQQQAHAEALAAQEAVAVQEAKVRELQESVRRSNQLNEELQSKVHSETSWRAERVREVYALRSDLQNELWKVAAALYKKDR
jgi:hypothetical protein